MFNILQILNLYPANHSSSVLHCWPIEKYASSRFFCNTTSLTGLYLKVNAGANKSRIKDKTSYLTKLMKFKQMNRAMTIILTHTRMIIIRSMVKYAVRVLLESSLVIKDETSHLTELTKL